MHFDSLSTILILIGVCKQIFFSLIVCKIAWPTSTSVALPESVCSSNQCSLPLFFFCSVLRSEEHVGIVRAYKDSPCHGKLIDIPWHTQLENMQWSVGLGRSLFPRTAALCLNTSMEFFSQGNWEGVMSVWQACEKKVDWLVKLNESELQESWRKNEKNENTHTHTH